MILSQNKNQLESFVTQLKEIVEDSNKSIYLTEAEKEQFLKKSEEIEDYVTFMGPQTKLEDVKKEIV